jgi:hypothetical protein
VTKLTFLPSLHLFQLHQDAQRESRREKSGKLPARSTPSS